MGVCGGWLLGCWATGWRAGGQAGGRADRRAGRQAGGQTGRLCQWAGGIIKEVGPRPAAPLAAAPLQVLGLTVAVLPYLMVRSPYDLGKRCYWLFKARYSLAIDEKTVRERHKEREAWVEEKQSQEVELVSMHPCMCAGTRANLGLSHSIRSVRVRLVSSRLVLAVCLS